MLIGHTIAAEYQNTTTVYSPWFPRQGDACTNVVDPIAIGGDATLTVYTETKNSEEVDSSANPVANSGAITSAGTPVNWHASSLEELVRYKVTLASSSGVSYCHFRILNPSWESTGAQSI